MFNVFGWLISFVRSPQKVLFLMLVLVVAACESRHEGVSSFKEAYVANKANDFEFSHFSFFGSEHVLILSSDKKETQAYSGLCKLHAMNCQRVYLDLNAKTSETDLKVLMSKIQSFEGDYFLLVSKDKDLKALAIAQYAKVIYKKSDKEIINMLKRFKPTKKERLYEVLGLSLP